MYYTFFHRYHIQIMLLSIAKAAALTALLCPIVRSLSLPSPEILRPRVPWKDTGLWEHQKRDGYPTGGCNHGPSSRGCWKGDFDIDTDMDEHWPDTGKVVKVGHLHIPYFEPFTDFRSTILRLQTRLWLQMGSQDR